MTETEMMANDRSNMAISSSAHIKETAMAILLPVQLDETETADHFPSVASHVRNMSTTSHSIFAHLCAAELKDASISELLLSISMGLSEEQIT